MWPQPGRVALSIGFGASRGWRLGFISFCGALLAVTCCCAGGFLGTPVSYLLGMDQPEPWVLVITAAGSASLVLVPIILLLVFIARYGAWLDGTVLTVRGLRTRTVDLAAVRAVYLSATNEMTAGTSVQGPVVMSGGLRTPVITVVDGAGTTVKLRLRSREGGLIPPAEMTFLAQALATARCPGAGETAAWLRAMAASPHTLLG